jgi:hypothetical protein
LNNRHFIGRRWPQQKKCAPEESWLCGAPVCVSERVQIAAAHL